MSDSKIDALESLRQKFTSGNSVPVDRAVITRAEYEALASAQQSADPVAEVIEAYEVMGHGWNELRKAARWHVDLPVGTKLYTNPPQASATVPEEIAPADVPAYWQDKSSNACAYAAGWNNCARAMLAASQPDAGKADDIDPCPGCRKGAVCRTPSCGRLKLPLNHPYRTGQQNAGKVGK